MGKLAFVFPGQGSQSIGMGKELYKNFNTAKNIFDMAGEQVKKLSFEGPQEPLNLTINAQPCLFTVSLAFATVLNENGVFADAMAGFSLGEIPALVHAGVMTTEQGFDFVRFRAKVMQTCSVENKGGMFAIIGLSPDEVVKICDKITGAYPANFNSAKQTVVACHEDSFEELQNHISANGGKAIKLATSGAFHSPLMNKAKEEIEEYLKAINLGEATKPIYSNVTAQIYDKPKELIARQVTSPVLWQKTIENMIEDGFDIFIEVGAGKVLSGLIKKISSTVKVLNVGDLATLEKAVSFISKGGKNA